MKNSLLLPALTPLKASEKIKQCKIHAGLCSVIFLLHHLTNKDTFILRHFLNLFIPEPPFFPTLVIKQISSEGTKTTTLLLSLCLKIQLMGIPVQDNTGHSKSFLHCPEVQQVTNIFIISITPYRRVLCPATKTFMQSCYSA